MTASAKVILFFRHFLNLRKRHLLVGQLLFLTFLCLTSLWGALAFSEELKSQSCRDPELARKDCRLRLGETQIDLNKESLLLTDGRWRRVFDLPKKSRISEWRKVRLVQSKKGQWLEIQFWEIQNEDLGTEGLFWYVGKIDGAYLNFHSRKRIGLRIRKVDFRGIQAEVYENLQKHSMRVNKNEKMELKLGLTTWTLSEKILSFEDRKPASDQNPDKKGKGAAAPKD